MRIAKCFSPNCLYSKCPKSVCSGMYNRIKGCHDFEKEEESKGDWN